MDPLWDSAVTFEQAALNVFGHFQHNFCMNCNTVKTPVIALYFMSVSFFL